MAPARARGHEQQVRTFDEVFGDVTHDERVALAWHLAHMRARRTVEALLPVERKG